MSRNKEGKTFNIKLQEQKNKILAQYEGQLTDLGLAKEQIEEQSLQELEASLERINDALKHPESFGVMNVKLSATVVLVITSVDSESIFQIGIVPVLLERKKLILERIKLIKENQGIQSLRDMIGSISENDVKEKLEKKINEISSFASKQAEETKKIENERIKAEIESQERLQKLEIEMMEKRANIRRSYFEKDSVAPFIGGALLLVLGGCLIVAMFTDIESTEIIDNTFLLILGYFFGQSVIKSSAEKNV